MKNTLSKFYHVISLTMFLGLGMAITFTLGFNRTVVSAASKAKMQPSRALSLAERVAYQRAIEEVYWRHRIWPEVNPGPKPSLDELMPTQIIQAKVEDYLRKSQALNSYWQKPITTEQLQSEMNRMARQTRQPAILRELFDALDNDPVVIAECLVRPTLVDQTIRSLYARDERFHLSAKQQAERAVAGIITADQMKHSKGNYSESELVKEDIGSKVQFGEAQPEGISLSLKDWDEQVNHLANDLERSNSEVLVQRKSGQPKSDAFGRIYAGQFSGLLEDDERFYVIGVVEKTVSNLRIARMEWKKTPFDSWWKTVAEESAPSQIETIGGTANASLRLATVAVNACTPDTWTATTTNNAPVGRTAHTAVWTGIEMIVWGGYAADGSYLGTGAKYNPVTDTWAAMTVTGAPSARVAHTAIWNGSTVVIWGGKSSASTDNSGTVNTGAMYNVSNDSWVATPISGAPRARSNHSVIWTGAAMVIWGGRTLVQTGSRTYEEVYLSTGARIAVGASAGTWAALPNSGAPAARTNHTAVWVVGTNEMVIWGGYDGSSFLNTGGRYRHLTNSWVPTTTTGAPASRQFHVAVSTGSEMIIFGGRGVENGVYNALNSGARYYPATNSWVALPTANAPERRYNSVAIFTGSEMIVWGGSYPTGSVPYVEHLNTGARFNLAQNTWTPMTAVNAPSARGQHTAIWTSWAGNEMIVWGGKGDSPGTPNTGGRYCVPTN